MRQITKVNHWVVKRTKRSKAYYVEGGMFTEELASAKRYTKEVADAIADKHGGKIAEVEIKEVFTRTFREV